MGHKGSGRKRKPIDAHVRDGTYRPDVHGAIEGYVRNAELGKFSEEPPEQLNEWGKKAWRETLDAIGGRGLLTAGDRGAFIAYCDSLGNYLEAMEEVRKTGMVMEVEKEGVDGKPGKVVKVLSAWYQIKRNALADAMRVGSLLGLTPVDRSRVVKALGAEEGSASPKAAPRKSLLTGTGGPLNLKIADEEE
jgi:P27 family predicted phage terminase small subunit